MAQAGQSLLFDSISGKVSNIVYVRTRSGTNVRVRIRPANPRTDSQTAFRDLLTAASQAARDLAAADVLLWRDAASNIVKTNKASGVKYSPSWFNYFCELAIPYLLFNPAGAPPSAPPAAPFEANILSVVATGGAGEISYAANAVQPADTTTEFYWQLLANPNRTPLKDKYRFKRLDAFPDDPFEVVLSGLDPGTYAAAVKFGKISTGQEGFLVELGKVTVT